MLSLSLSLFLQIQSSNSRILFGFLKLLSDWLGPMINRINFFKQFMIYLWLKNDIRFLIEKTCYQISEASKEFTFNFKPLCVFYHFSSYQWMQYFGMYQFNALLFVLKPQICDDLLLILTCWCWKLQSST